MGRAAKAIDEQKNDLALQLLDAVVELAPAYAEGWNRRAYVYYLQNNYKRAVGDLRRALALEPNHFKALEGLARILRDTGQKKSALEAYEQLSLKVNPTRTGAKTRRRRAHRRGRRPGHLALSGVFAQCACSTRHLPSAARSRGL